MWTEKEKQFLQDCITSALRYANRKFVRVQCVEKRHPYLATTLSGFPKDKRELHINVGPFYPGCMPSGEFAVGVIKTANEFLAKKYHSTSMVYLSHKPMNLNKSKNAYTTLDCFRIVATLAEDYL